MSKQKLHIHAYRAIEWQPRPPPHWGFYFHAIARLRQLIHNLLKPKTMNTKSVEYNVYHNTEIEQYIHERHRSIQDEFVTLAHNLGEKNKPDTFQAWESIQEAIKSKYNVLYTHVCKRLQGTATRKLGEADLARGRQVSETIDEQIDDVTEKTRILSIDIERMKLNYHWGA